MAEPTTNPAVEPQTSQPAATPDPQPTTTPVSPDTTPEPQGEPELLTKIKADPQTAYESIKKLRQENEGLRKTNSTLTSEQQAAAEKAEADRLAKMEADGELQKLNDEYKGKIATLTQDIERLTGIETRYNAIEEQNKKALDETLTKLGNKDLEDLIRGNSELTTLEKMAKAQSFLAEQPPTAPAPPRAGGGQQAPADQDNVLFDPTR